MSKITYKPILFSTPMVQAILEGKKTQTRRTIKFPDNWDGKTIYPNGNLGLKYGVIENGEMLLFRLYPKFEIGTILWVRETFQHTKCLNLHPSDYYGYVYKADNEPWDNYENWKWKPSIFMPKEAARLFLKVNNIRVERLHDISESDAIKEGIKGFCGVFYDYLSCEYYRNPYNSFLTLWTKINGKESWKENPYVWVYEFKVINKPYDFA
jgi:uncharacterized protein YhfF